MTYPVHVRTHALNLLADGVSRELVSKDLGVKTVTLDKWIASDRKAYPGRIPSVAHPALHNSTVGDVRSVLRRLDEGEAVHAIHKETGLTRQTIRRWRDDPKYREATLEFDPSFPYDHTDLYDRAVVAQHLCRQTTDPGERLDLLMAAVSTIEIDEFSVPTGRNTRGRA